MKIDGKEIAKAALARKKENMKLDEEGEVSEREQEDKGDHIKAMSSFIEAIHHKDPEAAHQHMMNYAKAQLEAKKEVE